jgi:hypothetical protein
MYQPGVAAASVVIHAVTLHPHAGSFDPSCRLRKCGSLQETPASPSFFKIFFLPPLSLLQTASANKEETSRFLFSYGAYT